MYLMMVTKASSLDGIMTTNDEPLDVVAKDVVDVFGSFLKLPAMLLLVMLHWIQLKLNEKAYRLIAERSFESQKSKNRDSCCYF